MGTIIYTLPKYKAAVWPCCAGGDTYLWCQKLTEQVEDLEGALQDLSSLHRQQTVAFCTYQIMLLKFQNITRFIQKTNSILNVKCFSENSAQIVFTSQSPLLFLQMCHLRTQFCENPEQQQVHKKIQCETTMQKIILLDFIHCVRV